MHHKYMVRDEAAIWTGSANWSIYSWTRQENVLAIVESSEIAREYLENFEELWKTGNVERQDRGDPNPIQVGEATVRVWFTPGHGEELAQRISLEARHRPPPDPDRLAGPDLGPDPRHAGRARRPARTSTSPE